MAMNMPVDSGRLSSTLEQGDGSSTMEDGLLSLKWNNHRSTFVHILTGLRDKPVHSDVTLACGGSLYPVHKLVLSSCSTYFASMFASTHCQHPVIVLKDIQCAELEALLDYMYVGEVDVRQSCLPSLIKAAECLHIKGLAVQDDNTADQADENEAATTAGPRGAKRQVCSSAGGSAADADNRWSSVTKRRRCSDSGDVDTNTAPSSSSIMTRTRSQQQQQQQLLSNSTTTTHQQHVSTTLKTRSDGAGATNSAGDAVQRQAASREQQQQQVSPSPSDCSSSFLPSQMIKVEMAEDSSSLQPAPSAAEGEEGAEERLLIQKEEPEEGEEGGLSAAGHQWNSSSSSSCGGSTAAAAAGELSATQQTKEEPWGLEEDAADTAAADDGVEAADCATLADDENDSNKIAAADDAGAGAGAGGAGAGAGGGSLQPPHHNLEHHHEHDDGGGDGGEYYDDEDDACDEYEKRPHQQQQHNNGSAGVVEGDDEISVVHDDSSPSSLDTQLSSVMDSLHFLGLPVYPPPSLAGLGAHYHPAAAQDTLQTAGSKARLFLNRLTGGASSSSSSNSSRRNMFGLSNSSNRRSLAGGSSNSNRSRLPGLILSSQQTGPLSASSLAVLSHLQGGAGRREAISITSLGPPSGETSPLSPPPAGGGGGPGGGGGLYHQLHGVPSAGATSTGGDQDPGPLQPPLPFQGGAGPSPEEPLYCPFCGKLCKRRDHLRLHIRIHTGEKPFQCPYCSRRTNQKNNLKLHIRNVHPGLSADV